MEGMFGNHPGIADLRESPFTLKMFDFFGRSYEDALHKGGLPAPLPCALGVGWFTLGASFRRSIRDFQFPGPRHGLDMVRLMITHV